MLKNPGYNLIRSKKRKKTISLCIQKDGGIAVYAPCNTPKHAIDKFFESKKPWIYKNLSRRKLKLQKPKRFIPGETFLYLGESYPLYIQDSGYTGQALEFSDNKFTIQKDYKNHAKEFFIRWYKKNALKKITARVKFYSRKLRLFPESLRITSAEHRWGSCSHKNVLSFTWRLIMTPSPVIDYIVVHELLHMREKNHSPKFWGLLEKIMPGYRKHRQWLKDNGYCMSL